MPEIVYVFGMFPLKIRAPAERKKTKTKTQNQITSKESECFGSHRAEHNAERSIHILTHHQQLYYTLDWWRLCVHSFSQRFHAFSSNIFFAIVSNLNAMCAVNVYKLILLRLFNVCEMKIEKL